MGESPDEDLASGGRVVPGCLPQVSLSLAHLGGWAKALGPKNLQEGPRASGYGPRLRQTAATFEATMPRGQGHLVSAPDLSEATVSQRDYAAASGGPPDHPILPTCPLALHCDLVKCRSVRPPPSPETPPLWPCRGVLQTLWEGPYLSLGLPGVPPTPAPAPGPSAPAARQPPEVLPGRGPC